MGNIRVRRLRCSRLLFVYINALEPFLKRRPISTSMPGTGARSMGAVFFTYEDELMVIFLTLSLSGAPVGATTRAQHPVTCRPH